MPTTTTTKLPRTTTTKMPETTTTKRPRTTTTKMPRTTTTKMPRTTTTKMPKTTTTKMPRTPKNEDAYYYDAKEPDEEPCGWRSTSLILHIYDLGAQHLFTNCMFMTVSYYKMFSRFHTCSYVHVHDGRQRRLPTLRLEETLSSSTQYAFNGMVKHKCLQRHGSRKVNL